MEPIFYFPPLEATVARFTATNADGTAVGKVGRQSVAVARPCFQTHGMQKLSLH